MKLSFEQKCLELLNCIGMDIWAFMDKLWGLGFSTTVDKSWLGGASPRPVSEVLPRRGRYRAFSSLAGQGGWTGCS